MPWMETVPMDQRTQFIADHRQGLYPVTELCARYGISRKTGYKWLTRFEDFHSSGMRFSPSLTMRSGRPTSFSRPEKSVTLSRATVSPYRFVSPISGRPYAVARGQSMMVYCK